MKRATKFGLIAVALSIFVLGFILAGGALYKVLQPRPAVAMPTPNPLTGFDFCSLNDLDTNKLIKADYQDYIKTIKLGKYDFIGDVEYSKNKLGEHAVSILVGDDGTWWNHILVYDKNDKRIKTVKYTSGGYRS